MRVTYIYWLRDPRNGALFYVGRTINPIRREYEHCHIRREHPQYLKDLLASGHKPQLEIVEIVPGGGFHAERKWWGKLKEFGHPVCNTMRHAGSTGLNPPKIVFKKSRWQIRCERAQRIKERWRKWYDSLTDEEKSEYQRKKLDNGGKERMIATQKGRTLDRELVERRREPLKQALAKPQAKEKMRIRNKRFWDSMSVEQREAFIKSRWESAKQKGRTGFIKIIP